MHKHSSSLFLLSPSKGKEVGGEQRRENKCVFNVFGICCHELFTSLVLKGIVQLQRWWQFAVLSSLKLLVFCPSLCCILKRRPLEKYLHGQTIFYAIMGLIYTSWTEINDKQLEQEKGRSGNNKCVYCAFSQLDAVFKCS